MLIITAYDAALDSVTAYLKDQWEQEVHASLRASWYRLDRSS